MKPHLWHIQNYYSHFSISILPVFSIIEIYSFFSEDQSFIRVRVYGGQSVSGVKVFLGSKWHQGPNVTWVKVLPGTKSYAGSKITRVKSLGTNCGGFFIYLIECQILNLALWFVVEHHISWIHLHHLEISSVASYR